MIVLDVNAAVAMVSGAPEGEGLRELMLQGEPTLAPEFFKVELLNVLRKYVKGGYVSEEVALNWYKAAVCLVDGFVSVGGTTAPSLELASVGDMGAEILHESLSSDHPSYDVAYMVLARRTGSTLFTLDKCLAQVCVERGANCVEMVKL